MILMSIVDNIDNMGKKHFLNKNSNFDSLLFITGKPLYILVSRPDRQLRLWIDYEVQAELLAAASPPPRQQGGNLFLQPKFMHHEMEMTYNEHPFGAEYHSTYF